MVGFDIWVPTTAVFDTESKLEFYHYGCLIFTFLSVYERYHQFCCFFISTIDQPVFVIFISNLSSIVNNSFHFFMLIPNLPT